MKIINIKLKIAFFAIMLVGFTSACNNESKNVEENDDKITMEDNVDETNASDNLASLLTEYMAVKNALTEDNFEEVSRKAKELLQQYYSLNEPGLTEQQSSKLEASIEQLAEAKDIKAQREYFASLSNELYELVKAKKLTSQTMYWAHCPMAMNNKGASWLSYEEKIQNPYMGKEMPACGSVKETIK